MSTWNLALDRNTVYTLGWYQYYLQRMATHETAISQYATAVRRNETLRNKLALLADQFLKKICRCETSFKLTACLGIATNVMRMTRKWTGSFVRSRNSTTISPAALRLWRGEPARGTRAFSNRHKHSDPHVSWTRRGKRKSIDGQYFIRNYQVQCRNK